MTWVTPRVWVAGERLTASKMNEISSSLSAVYPHTTAGDIAYRDASSAILTRLAKVTGGILYGGASVPAYLANVAGGVLHGGASLPAFSAAGTLGQFLKSNGTSAPAFEALVYRRQGGSSTNWEAVGTTTYTPTIAVLQAGARSVSYTSGVGSQAITYPVAFAQRPIVLALANFSTPDITVTYSDNSTTGCTLRVRNVGGGSGSVDVVWLAIGA